MTDTITATLPPEPETEAVTITPFMERIIRHMLDNPRGQYYTTGICEAIGGQTGGVSPLMRRMEAAGWLESHTEPRRSHQPRRYYRFTRGTAAMLRKVIT